MDFKGKKNYSLFSLGGYAILSWVIIMALLVFFLSSPRPAGAALTVSDGQQGPVQLFRPAPWWVKGSDPVPYQYWDTSTWLNGWYDMFSAQLALGIILAHGELERKQELQLIRDNHPGVWFWCFVTIFFSVIAAGCYWSDKLLDAGKRLLVWRKD